MLLAIIVIVAINAIIFITNILPLLFKYLLL